MKLLIREKGKGRIVKGYCLIQKNYVRKYEHIEIVENILRRSLPQEVEIHHVDGNRSNNNHTNLVVCPNRAYHRLLHQRQRALDACGNPSWRKCGYCKQYSPAHEIVHKNHPACSREKARQRYLLKNGEKP